VFASMEPQFRPISFPARFSDMDVDMKESDVSHAAQSTMSGDPQILERIASHITTCGSVVDSDKVISVPQSPMVSKTRDQ